MLTWCLYCKKSCEELISDYATLRYAFVFSCWALLWINEIKYQDMTMCRIKERVLFLLRLSGTAAITPKLWSYFHGNIYSQLKRSWEIVYNPRSSNQTHPALLRAGLPSLWSYQLLSRRQRWFNSYLLCWQHCYPSSQCLSIVWAEFRYNKKTTVNKKKKHCAVLCTVCVTRQARTKEADKQSLEREE